MKSNNDEVATVYLVFGLEAKDLDVCSFSDASCDGDSVYDADFNPNTVEAQNALIVSPT